MTSRFISDAEAIVLSVIAHGGNTVYSNELVAEALEHFYELGQKSPVVAAPVAPVVTLDQFPTTPTGPLSPSELLAQLDAAISAGKIHGDVK